MCVVLAHVTLAYSLKSSPGATVRFMPPSSKPNVPICGASLSASADCGVGIICSLDCPAHAARMEVDRISVIIFVTAGLDRKHIILKCLKRGKHKVNLLICSRSEERRVGKECVSTC